MIRLAMDGKKIEVEPGRTLLEAARDNDIHIPTLCYHEALEPYGGCRTCVVDVEGAPRPVPSCATPIEDGMVVASRSERVEAHRRTLVELLMM